jgi:hypothetical protein
MRLKVDRTPQSTAGSVVYDCNHIKEGQTILYEGKEATVIHAKPMFVIKVQGRVICGALRNRIKLIAQGEKHSCQDEQY